MSFSTTNKSAVIKEFQSNPKDTASPEVQIALLSARIDCLTVHFKAHTHDANSRRGLLRLVSQRRKLLTYLERSDSVRYRKLIERLKLRR
ncbi:MAG: 30S ribosomal protein S15 [Gammaproteobacteria bacterium CG_4_10_14_0_8_um_filter_38_16]|nr:MAG: 30S ribosomal protein S15 [Gammaproteobacteria bacterium CG_4_10_14_0_8_um_filter_38_16]PJA04355.1 MAG: 30S ribosomal protein S15 [Gammaproteobacteria bacterium CG_4_10_14_0_2_um_filter_38_22]PJB09544.1 MAG: 30S ribosomal protein S15 [Gammaproteobacteria bacterium CG_4_9_14_3_um_filter_38_9]